MPAFKKGAFHCQVCAVFAPQAWERLYDGHSVPTPIYTDTCSNCGFISYWHKLDSGTHADARMLYPVLTAAPLPHPEMPEDVKQEYQEAARIVAQSPRGAGALVRLALQKLMAHLGEKGKDLNEDIGSLVRKGLDPDVQRALDALRVVGNNAVHPLELDLRDDQETVGALFGLINFIVEDRIARPKKLDALYGNLPEGAREAIERRDSVKTSTGT